jgi:hypothetical protein
MDADLYLFPFHFVLVRDSIQDKDYGSGRKKAILVLLFLKGAGRDQGDKSSSEEEP